VAEADDSGGPLDRYDVASQTFTGTVDDGGFNYEVAVNRDGSQFAVLTYGGTFIYDTNLNVADLLGTDGSQTPIGVAYNPKADLAYFAWASTTLVGVYETHTMAPVAVYDTGYNIGYDNGALGKGRTRVSRDGKDLFVSVGSGIEWFAQPALPPSDLSLSINVSNNIAWVGSNFTYNISVTNLGTNAVPDAQVFDRLPPGVTFVSAAAANGFCTQSNGLVKCTFATVPPGSQLELAIQVTANAIGTETNTASLVAFPSDPNPSNNWAAIAGPNVKRPPLAVNDAVTFVRGTAQISFNVLANDVVPEGDPLTVQSFTLPGLGTLTEVTNGLFNYAPSLNFTNGQDQFGYTVIDSYGMSSTATVTITASSQPFAGGDWTTFGNGSSHTGYYPASLSGAVFLPVWSTNLGENLNQAAVGAGRVYVTPVTYFGPTFVAALDALTGRPLWQDTFNSAFSINPPTYDSGRLYVQRGDSYDDTQLWCLNAPDGSTNWSAPHSAQWERYYAPTVYNGDIWVDGGAYGGLYGFNSDGAQLFFYDGLAQYDEWTPAYYQGLVYTWVAGQFAAHDPQTGAEQWEVDMPWNWRGWSMNTAPAIDGGLAFVEQPPNLRAVDLTGHVNIWTVDDGATGSPAVSKGVVYAITGGAVQAYSAQTGSSLGQYTAPNDSGLAGQPIITDDTLLTASGSATYIFNLASQSLQQTIPYGGSLSLANGWLYIAGGDGTLRAYQATNYHALDHFSWSAVASPQYANSPFTVTIQPVDSSNRVITNYQSPLIFTAMNGVPVRQAGGFNQGVWLGTVSVEQAATNVVLRADNGWGQFGLANPITVLNPPVLTPGFSKGALKLYWPTNGSPFVLEVSGDLIKWTPLMGQPSQNGNQCWQSITPTGSNAFYRLVRVEP
jgi:uncharacterized repeat protein (TIGR01451 family)